MKFIRISPRAVLLLREKLQISQQELAARVGCSLSAVQFWEAGRSSPRGYRLRRLLELCPDQETRALFSNAPVEAPSPSKTPGPQPSYPGHAEMERRYLDPAFLNTLPAETRDLYRGTVENILQLSAMKIEGNKVAAEGLRLLAESIIQMAGEAADTRRGRQAKVLSPTPKKTIE